MKPTAATRSFALRIVVAIVVVMAVAVAVNVAAHGRFLATGNMVNVLRQITYNCVLGVGETFVIITAGIDLSIASLVSMTGVLMAIIANALPFHGFALVATTLIAGMAIGAAAGYVNALPVVKLNLPPFITTLAMMQVALGISFIASGGRPVDLNSTDFQSVGIGTFLHTGLPNPVLWMAAVLVVASVLLMRTRFGRYVFALGGNEEAARLAGVKVGQVKTLVYVISGICSAIVGFLYMAQFSTGSPQTGQGSTDLLYAIAAVVVGGTSLMGGRGSIVGTFFGALLIGLLLNSMNLLQVNSYLQWVVIGAVILLAVIVDELRKRYLRAA